MRGVDALRAYRAGAGHRSLREQEADLFHRVNAMLLHARADDPIGRARAIADNDRLWTTVIDLMRDPQNALPSGLRAAMVSVGLAVKREASRPEPDFDFIIEINGQIAAGLRGA